MGRKGLATSATIASPETILRWYRELVAKKYDGSQQRGQGRPKTLHELLPGARPLPFERRSNPGFGEDVGDSGSGDLDAESRARGAISIVGESSLLLGASQLPRR
jgi:hypothetical protein